MQGCGDHWKEDKIVAKPDKTTESADRKCKRARKVISLWDKKRDILLALWEER